MDPEVLPGWEAGEGVGSAEQGTERGTQRKEENRKEDQQGEKTNLHTLTHTLHARQRTSWPRLSQRNHKQKHTLEQGKATRAGGRSHSH